MSQDSIPLVDLSWQHERVRDEVERRFKDVMDRTAFVLGDEVEEFESRFADFSGARHFVGVASGTDAIELALRAHGIGGGDEVIVPANTFIATALGVARTGATPVLVDCDPTYQLIDVEEVRQHISDSTAAIMPVHLFGQMAPMGELSKLAEDRGVALIEDAAQSQGALHENEGAASRSSAAATSFYPGKNLGAYGDAGGVLTNNDEIATKLRALRNYGSEVKYHHPDEGFNSRLDTLQAAVLLAKLEHLGEWNELRRQAANRYHELLEDVPEVGLPAAHPANEHVWHLYVVRVPNRDEVLRQLQNNGVGAGIHYPVPIHQQGAFDNLGHGEGDFPESERAAREILSIPIYPGITADQQERVCDLLVEAVRTT